MADYQLHIDVIAVMADAFFQKQIVPVETLGLLNSRPETDYENWVFIQSLIRYHPRLMTEIPKLQGENYVGGDYGDWNDFVDSNSEGDPADPMQMMRMLRLKGDMAPAGNKFVISGSNYPLNHMSHLWQEIVPSKHQSINYDTLKITI